MQSALLTTVLALAAPLVSAATLPRDVVEVEARDTTVPGKICPDRGRSAVQ